MSLFMLMYRKRTCSRTVTITDANGDNVSINTGDQVRIKVGRAGQTPILDWTSKSNTSNGSSVSRANPSTVRFDQKDVDFSPGVYDIEASIVDNDDGSDIKHADEGVFVLKEPPTGDVTI